MVKIAVTQPIYNSFQQDENQHVMSLMNLKKKKPYIPKALTLKLRQASMMFSVPLTLTSFVF